MSNLTQNKKLKFKQKKLKSNVRNNCQVVNTPKNHTLAPKQTFIVI